MSDDEDDFDKLLNKMEGSYPSKTSLKEKEGEAPVVKKQQNAEYVLR